MSITENEIELTDYDGKRVEILFEGADEYIEGTVASSSPKMLAFKPKGKSNLQLIQVEDIIDIRIAPDTEAVMKPRRLNLVNIDTVKRHLVDRHGYKLDDINAMSPEDAFSFHEGLTHEGLAHFHADPPSKSGS